MKQVIYPSVENMRKQTDNILNCISTCNPDILHSTDIKRLVRYTSEIFKASDPDAAPLYRIDDIIDMSRFTSNMDFMENYVLHTHRKEAIVYNYNADNTFQVRLNNIISLGIPVQTMLIIIFVLCNIRQISKPGRMSIGHPLIPNQDKMIIYGIMSNIPVILVEQFFAYVANCKMGGSVLTRSINNVLGFIQSDILAISRASMHMCPDARYDVDHIASVLSYIAPIENTIYRNSPFNVEGI